ncbi:MAG: N-acetylmuramoyl-L-alanine amidase [Eubacteriales bacterium]|nr:N-acetylmuramoyl-L-alanine amidase [Eubacteriales bacterium]
MPSVYLSPSTQEFNQYIGGGDEEYYMNLIVDAMIPYLRASGIEFARNNPGDSIPEIIEQSNANQYNLHLALQSTDTPDGLDAPLRGIDVYHFAVSPVGGERAAYLIYQNLKDIYPVPELVQFVPNVAMIELRLTNAPAVLVELGYHDNPEDSFWIKNNIAAIGRNLALSVAEFLQVPFVEPQQQIFVPESPAS